MTREEERAEHLRCNRDLVGLLYGEDLPADDVWTRMAELGHTEPATRRAKNEIGARSYRIGNRPGRWWWTLDSTECPLCGGAWETVEDLDLDEDDEATEEAPAEPAEVPQDATEPGDAPSPEVLDDGGPRVRVCSACGRPASGRRLGQLCIYGGGVGWCSGVYR